MSDAAESNAGPRKPRYGEHAYGDRMELAVRVTAADYNGDTWDGRPFSTVPDWLMDAVVAKKVVPHTRGGTDYAQWDVATARGTVNATPGDWIVRREDGSLSVVEEQDAFILINLRPPVSDDRPEAKR